MSSEPVPALNEWGSARGFGAGASASVPRVAWRHSTPRVLGGLLDWDERLWNYFADAWARNPS
jgi:hypothetical protein